MASLARLVLPDGLTFELNGPCTMGRSPSNAVALSNNHVSRKHALIQVQGDGECWMVDLGSSNGTYVNGRRVSRPLALKNGDLIEMAGSLIEFQTEVSAVDGGTRGGSTLTLRDIKKRNCWLMVADIVGATRMAHELPPEELPQITGGWFNACRELIEEHGGHMNQYLGDGFFCYWEDTFDAKSQILEAVRALVKMQVKASPGFRVVLHCGETVFSNVPNTSEQNLHGREVHFAFRMEKLAGGWKDSWLLSDAACQALGVKSLICRASQVSGYEGVYQFHVPDFST